MQLQGKFLKLQGDENPLQQGIMENRTLTRRKSVEMGIFTNMNG